MLDIDLKLIFFFMLSVLDLFDYINLSFDIKGRNLIVVKRKNYLVKVF